jgi:hypothetical protein
MVADAPVDSGFPMSGWRNRTVHRPHDWVAHSLDPSKKDTEHEHIRYFLQKCAPR